MSPVLGAAHLEACLICLEHQKHTSGVLLSVKGHTETQFRLQWEEAITPHLLVDSTIEPTRSVLLRSAASLAYLIGRYQDAIRLITIAIEGHPPAEIAEELRELWNQVFDAMREKSAGD